MRQRELESALHELARWLLALERLELTVKPAGSGWTTRFGELCKEVYHLQLHQGGLALTVGWKPISGKDRGTEGVAVVWSPGGQDGVAEARCIARATLQKEVVSRLRAFDAATRLAGSRWAQGDWDKLEEEWGRGVYGR